MSFSKRASKYVINYSTRDCKDVDFKIYTQTQPIIESSTNMRFGCYEFHYDLLRDHFKAAKLNPFINPWSTIYDFTPQPNNWSILPRDFQFNFKPVPTHLCSNIDDDVVPYTYGDRAKPTDDSVFVLFIESNPDALKEILRFAHEHPRIVLVQTKESVIKKEQAQSIFLRSTIGSEKGFVQSVITGGPKIGLEFNGEGVLDAVTKVVEGIRGKHKIKIYVSEDLDSAQQEVSNFFEQANLRM